MTEEREPRPERGINRPRQPRQERQPRREPEVAGEEPLQEIGQQVGVAIERLKKRDLKQTALIAFVIGVLFHACVIYAVLGSGGGKESPPLPGVVEDNGTPRPTVTATATNNRRDCDAIRGTQYRSDDERIWFLANCKPG